MSPRDPLSLPEEIMLVALHDEKGTTKLESWYAYAVGGAILAELLMRQRVELDPSKKRTVRFRNGRTMGDPLLDESLQRVRDAKKPLAAQTWVGNFASIKNLKHRLAERLCDRGILRLDQDKILLLFSRQVYPEIDPRPEREIIERLRKAIFTETDQLDSRTVVLVSLAHSAGLLSMVFDKKDLKARQDRIERILNGDALGKATQEAVEAMQAAAFVACIMPAILTTTVTK